jgi:HEAT repeat protein
VVATLGAAGDAAMSALFSVLRTQRDSETRIAAAVDALAASSAEVDARIIAELVEHADPAVVADGAQILGRRRRMSSVPALARLIVHRDDNVAVAAIEALGRIGGRGALEPLVAAVRSGNFFRVFPAIDVLGRSGDPRAVAPLAQLLTDARYGPEAARALARTGEKTAVAPLVELLAHPTEAWVRLGATALADLARQHQSRYGEGDPLAEYFHEHRPPQAVPRMLARSLTGAEPTEQVAICKVLAAIDDPSVVPQLTQLLDGGETVASAAAEALKSRALSADADLVAALREGNSERRQVILPVMARTTAVPDIVLCLSDADPRVRALACEALARIGAVGVVKSLFPLLADPNPGVVQAAIGAVQSLGSRDTEALVLEAARHPSATVRRSAMRIIAYFGYGSAMPQVEAGIRDADPRVRDAAIQSLAFVDHPSALPQLLAAAKAADEKVRSAAMRALGNCAVRDARVGSLLIKGLEDPAAWVRYYACQSLGKLAVELAVKQIAARVHDPAGQVRVAAVEALAHLSSDEAQEVLREAATSAEPDIQRAALIGLGIGRRPASLAPLLAACRSEDPATRLVALSAVVEFPAKDVVPMLASAAADPDPTIRSAAVGLLAGRDGPEATEALIALLDGHRQEELVDALSVPVPGRIAALLSGLETANEEVAPMLTSALARMRRPDATASLREAVVLPNVAARKAAATSLGALGTREALGVLRDVAERDPDLQVRQICTLLLAAP